MKIKIFLSLFILLLITPTIYAEYTVSTDEYGNTVYIENNEQKFPNGTIIGDLYATDIKAYINDFEIPSYNIGGKTCICVEDLQNYGYTVAYFDNVRRLLFSHTYNYLPSSVTPFPSFYTSTPSGTIIGNIFATDITTDLFGYGQLPSYNIGGWTCICIEEIAIPDYFSDGSEPLIYTWNSENRTISLNDIYYTDFNNLLNVCKQKSDGSVFSPYADYLFNCFNVGGVQEKGDSVYGILKSINNSYAVIDTYSTISIPYGDLRSHEKITIKGKKLLINHFTPDGQSFYYRLYPPIENVDDSIMEIKNFGDYFYENCVPYDESKEYTAQSRNCYILDTDTKQEQIFILDENVKYFLYRQEMPKTDITDNLNFFTINMFEGKSSVEKEINRSKNNVFRFIVKNGKVIYIFSNSLRNKLYDFSN